MIDGEIKCIYDVSDVHVILSVKNDDFESRGNEIYGLAEMFCRIIKDGNYNADIIIDHMKQEFDYEKEEDSE